LGRSFRWCVLGVREDLLEVVDEEFKRIYEKYKKINSLCEIIDFARVDFVLEVFYPPEVVDGLPCRRAVYFAFSGGREIVVNDIRYDVVFVSGDHEHVLALIEVLMFGDRCFISKDVDRDGLEMAVRDIVGDGLKELPEEES
jgi:hypothetical protein